MSEKQLKIINDYYIQYSGDEELFDLHKPSDIRCLIGLLNCALCRQEKTIEALEKENEQLKEELNNLKKDETMLYHYYTLARYSGDGV